MQKLSTGNRQKSAGQSTREMAAKRYKNRVWFVLLTVAIVLLILLVANNSKALGIGGFGFLGLIILSRVIMNYSDARAKKMIKEEKRAIRGAKGEEKIGSLLENLGEDYLVIHDIESPYGNIDHIVISKQGGSS
jgi:Nuclease-related domain.